MQHFSERDQCEARLENQDKCFEDWAAKMIEKYKAEGKNTDILMKELAQFKYK